MRYNDCLWAAFVSRLLSARRVRTAAAVASAGGGRGAGGRMSFLRHGEIYRPMVAGKTPKRPGCDRAPAHRRG